MIIQEKYQEDNMNKKEILKGKFTITSPSKEINPLELMDASIKTGVPIVFTGDRISNFELKKDEEIINIEEIFKMEGTKINGIKDDDISKIKDLQLTGIKFIPGSIVPLKLRVKDTDCGFDNLLFRGKTIRNRLKISTEERNFPYKFEFDINNKNPDGDFKINLDSNANIKQMYNWEKFIKTLKEKITVNLINPENNKLIFTFDITTINAGDEAWCEFLKKLVKIQEATHHKIELPQYFKISKEDEYNVDLAFKIINGEQDKIGLENVSLVTNIITLKKIMEKAVMLVEFHEDFTLKIFGKKIPFGTFKLNLKDYDLLYKDETNFILEDAHDEDHVKVWLKPKGNGIIAFNNYPKS